METASIIGEALIVDDSALQRKMLHDICETAGYSVTQAHDGLQAIHAVNAANFDLIITDIEMPNVDGLQFLNVLAHKKSTAGVIIASSYGDGVDQLRQELEFLDRLHILGTLSKPYPIEDLLDLLTNLERA